MTDVHRHGTNTPGRLELCHVAAEHDWAVVHEKNHHALVKTPPYTKLEALYCWNLLEK
jgi:hypothetical protein